MDPAWLDSLSEDWISQPTCETSADKLPPFVGDDDSEAATRREHQSRIPPRTPNSKSSLSRHRNISRVLSERSANDINISRRRLPSRLSQENKALRVQKSSRSVSSAGNGSVIHNSLQQNVSSEWKGETPEWKRRLVLGKMPYGEQRDLFCSTAAGLQDMFRPPPPNADVADQSETTLPSSPPSGSLQLIDSDPGDSCDTGGNGDHGAHVAVTPSASPRQLQPDIGFRLNGDDALPPSNVEDSSRGPDSTWEGLRLNDANVRHEGHLAVTDYSAGPSRKPSGQSAAHHEDFSPILIGKRTNEQGRIDFAPVQVPVDELKQKLENLRINQMHLDARKDLQTGFDLGEEDAVNAETTEDYIRNGGFVNICRGGRSGDGSFYNRGLSSDIGVDSSDMLPEESLQASTPKQFPTIRTQDPFPHPTARIPHSPSIPCAPFPSPEKGRGRDSTDGHTASSPLKLFGPYDTFTNQTLLRRISQFEETSGSPSRQSLDSNNQESFFQPLQGADKGPRVRAVSRFGGDDLDGYEFPGGLSSGSSKPLEAHGKDNVTLAPALSNIPSLQHPRKRSPDSAPALLVGRRRHKSFTSSTKPAGASSVFTQNNEYTTLPNSAPASAGTPKREEDSEGKRPRTSPSKDPTPKRRRTLHRSDFAFEYEDQLAAVDSAHRLMQGAMGKKRKDARPGDFELAEPSVLAMRSILWPRSSTSSLSLLQHERPVDSSSKALQGEYPVLPRDGRAETDGKPSIRTQDFVDQAAQIMAMIRSQVRTGLASLEESEAENDGANPRVSLTDSYQESTYEPFSRPPSRNGKPLSRIPQRQQDPELVNRLKQYQERSDMGDIVSVSLRSLSLGKNALSTGDPDGQDGTGSRAGSDDPINVQGNIVSDLENVRITSNQAQIKERLSPSKDFPTDSSGRVTSRSYPTTSSRGSELRRTIMPESVSHLIPDRVGSMYLDKQNNIWVKRKGLKSPLTGPPPSDDSEDDPFANIPDLSVDMTKELQNLGLATAQRETASDDAELRRSPRSPLSTRSRQPSLGCAALSSKEQSGPHIAGVAREQLEMLKDRAAMRSTTSQRDVDWGMGIHDNKAGDLPSAGKRRNLTISFSSPIASIIHDVVAADLDTMEDDPDHWHEESQAEVLEPAWKNGPQELSCGTSQGTRRLHSARGAGFVPRPVSRIDEQDEESTVEIQPGEDLQVGVICENSIVSHKTSNGRHSSLSFIINRTPNQGALSFQQDESAIIGRNVGKLSLSPLSEFTLNNSDQSFGFEVSYVMGPRHMATGDGSKRVMSVTIRELVDKIGEVEPYEPFWEDITELDLHDKQLTSLHMLEEFCGRVIVLDASKNKLGHLDGVPPTVRQLKVSQNMLTELTSWDHLMNLQYVDISGNEVKSLSALKNLIHLRSIRADDNQLTSLDGLGCHDGLLTLRARNNLIESLDFSTVVLERLSELDLDGNRISSIQHLELLPTLSRLRLQRNRLRQLTVDGSMKTLRQLDVSDNELTLLDLSTLPNIRSVHADRNRIGQLSGFERARRLDSLSLREQRSDLPLDLSFLARAHEIRKLFLSGNYLGRFEPVVDFLNLQLLDLANCGLQSLPENMGQLMPNLRTLNVNFNAIADLSPLQFIPRLKKLLAAGNRLADSTAVTQVLTEFPHLAQLDVRDNPVTLGFYAPLQVLVSANQCGYGDLFLLPDADVERDELFAGRLDEATRLRRRLHQIVLVSSCRRLRNLDGLPVRRREALARDDLLQTLVAEGLVPELEDTLVARSDTWPNKDGQRAAEAEVDAAADAEATAQLEAGLEATRPKGTPESRRWSREDSFA